MWELWFDFWVVVVFFEFVVAGAKKRIHIYILYIYLKKCFFVREWKLSVFVGCNVHNWNFSSITVCKYQISFLPRKNVGFITIWLCTWKVFFFILHGMCMKAREMYSYWSLSTCLTWRYYRFFFCFFDFLDSCFAQYI